MKPNPKVKKEVLPRKDFSQRLADKIRESELGEVDEGVMSDKSCKWVELRIKDRVLAISFDIKGNSIQRIGVYKDVVEVTGQKQVFGKQ